LWIGNANQPKNAVPESLGFVPAPEIKEICGLQNKIYTDYDFCEQRATPIYSGIAYNCGMKDRFIYRNKNLTI
jgi:hypothetical protein